MSIEALNWALATNTKTSAAKVVLLILANRANEEGKCWPGMTGIGKQACMTRRGVLNNIRKLEHMGLLSTVRQPQPLTNIYQLNLQSSALDALGNEVPSEQGSLVVGNEVPIDRERGSHETKVTQIETKAIGRKTVPKSWMVSDAGAEFAGKKGMNPEEFAEELQLFKDHEFKAARKDFDACWRSWCTNWKKYKRTDNAKTRNNRSFDDMLAENRTRAGLD